MKSAYVYILGSKQGVLYIGVTSNLDGRVFEHRNGIKSGFASKYQCHRLIYFEEYQYMTSAIAREKELKGWRREKKLALVSSMNPEMRDLAEGWGQPIPGFEWPRS
jgi:putative endonuclease